MDTTAAGRWDPCPRAAQAVQTVHRAAVVNVFQGRAERTNHAQLKQTKLDNKRTETDNRIKTITITITISIIHNGIAIITSITIICIVCDDTHTQI